jgi:hypothetical protein
MFMSPLDPLFRNEIEANGTSVSFDEFVQRRIAGRTLGRVADLQDVFCRVLRVHLEGMHGPRLDRADAGAGRKFVLGGFFEEMNRGLDAFATAYVDARAMLEMMDRRMTVTMLVVFAFIDEDEGLGVDFDARRRQHIEEFAHGYGLGNLGFENPWSAMDLNEDDRF